MKLVEVVRTVLTADDVHATVREVCAKVAQAPGGLRRPGRVHRERAAVPVPEQRGEDGRRSTTRRVDDIDAAMKLGGGYPMGPFELLDVVGLDVSLAIEKVLHQRVPRPGSGPAPLLEHLVAAGCLGRKTGRGFREYARR